MCIRDSPVIEKQLPPDEPYIANDVYLDSETQQILIITGPNTVSYTHLDVYKRQDLTQSVASIIGKIFQPIFSSKSIISRFLR